MNFDYRDEELKKNIDIELVEEQNTLDFTNAYFEGMALNISGSGSVEIILEGTKLRGSSIKLDENSEIKRVKLTLKGIDMFGSQIIAQRSKVRWVSLDVFGCSIDESIISFDESDIKKLTVNFDHTGVKKSTFSLEGGNYTNLDIVIKKSTLDRSNLNLNRVISEKCNVDFEYLNMFDGEFAMDKAKLKEVLNLERCNFDGTRVTFCEGKFEDLNFLRCDFINSKMIVNGSDINKISFERCVMRQIVSFKSSKIAYFNFYDSLNFETMDLRMEEVGVMSIIDCKNVGIIYLDWHKNNIAKAIKEKIKEAKHTDLLKKAELYNDFADTFRVLKENFYQTGNYSYEDEAYVEFKRCHQKAMISKLKHNIKNERLKLKITSLFGLFMEFVKWFISDFVGCYATKPIRVFFTMILSIGVFSFSYYASQMPLDKFGDGVLNRALCSIYYSSITFLTIGYGDIHPKGVFPALLSGVEGFLGLFLMSYFTVSFARKILR